MATEQVTEEIVEEVAEVVEKTGLMTGREFGFLITGLGIGIAAGFSVGFYLMEKRVDAKYNKICEDAIQEMREHYNSKIVAATPKPDLEDMVEETSEEERYTPEELQAIDETNAKFPAESDFAPATTNIFDSDGVEVADHWDYSKELSKRRPDIPYIIHLDEFNENAPEHTQTDLTYYDEDRIVADSRDSVVPPETYGGEDNLKFGHGSENPWLVYIRNDRLDLDMEINKNEGSYTETIQNSIKHSSERRRHIKRRFDDEAD